METNTQEQPSGQWLQIYEEARAQGERNNYSQV